MALDAGQGSYFLINWTRCSDTQGVIYEHSTPIGKLTINENLAVLEPHVEWLPAATKRNIYQAVQIVLTDLSSIKPTIITARQSIAPVWDLWVKRGLLRKVGILTGISDFNEIHIFQVNT